MTAKELIDHLSKLPPDLPVFLSDREGSFDPLQPHDVAVGTLARYGTWYTSLPSWRRPDHRAPDETFSALVL